MTMRIATIIFAIFLLGCSTPASRASYPPDYPGWSIGYTTQAYMPVWIETIDVEDIEGRLFTRIGSGSAGIDFAGSPAGWNPPKSLGGGRIVRGAALPKHIYVRWQSLVEPQTYSAAFDVPERARQWLLQRDRGKVVPELSYRRYLILDLAPGGWLKVWITGPAGVDSEVLCMRGEIEPKGPFQRGEGARYVTLHKDAENYLKQHPVPFDSWNCD